MKTIFITAFEGVEVKNILRTDTLPTLLADPEVRIVALVKSAERAERYHAEFNDPRIIYEVVERRPLRGLDKLLTSFKFTMLRTETTTAKRKREYEEDGRWLSYAWDTAINYLASRRIVLALVRLIDRLLVRNDLYVPLFDKYQPSLVFLAHLFDELEVDLLREAKRRGIRTVGLINSWDKVTSRAVLRQVPDHFLVFTEIVKHELVRYAAYPASRITVVGLPQYDSYFRGEPSSREAFFSRIKVAPEKKLIVYAPLGSSFTDADWEMIDLFHTHLERGSFGTGVEMLVRFQPNDFLDQAELDRRPWLIYDYPGTRFSATRGVDWDMGPADLAHLKDTLTHMSLLVCFASSLSVDAAAFNKPVINIGFEREGGKPTKSATQYFEREHYKNALATGGIRLVRSEAELVEWVSKYLTDPSLDQEGRSRLVREQVVYTDGESGKRVGRALLSFLPQ